MNNKKVQAIVFAILAAVFYAINMPFSKMLLGKVEPTYMASFLYFGAGIGIFIIYIVTGKYKNSSKKLAKSDLVYVVGMIVLDIVAPILLMVGLMSATSSNASLINNFEIVATSLIALFVFKELISKRLWFAIVLITISSLLLSFEDMSSLKISWGSLCVLLAAICWGFENNCTRKISSKDTFQIVILKGIFSGLGSFIIANLVNEALPEIKYIIAVLCLGFIAYGLSIFMYIKAQKELGAAKTSAFYSIAPFIGAFLSFIILKEALTASFVGALFLMIIGTIIVGYDTLKGNSEVFNRIN